MNEKSDRFLARGGAWVIVQFVLMALVIALGVLFHGEGARLAIKLAGLVILAAGGWCGIAGVLALGRNRTPYPQPRAGSELVRHGIYSRVRHPLYTSVMLVSIGWALIWESGASLLVAVLLVPFFHAKARREESWLRERYSGYADYARRTPRFVPRVLSRIPAGL